MPVSSWPNSSCSSRARWQRSASYVTFTYVFNRLRYYAPAPFAFLEWLGRAMRFGPFTFRVPVGEMEAWASRER